jgi:hypothetical protein
MAFDSANLACYGHANGFGLFRYDSIDALDTIDDGGYFNNTDDNQNLAIGDLIHAFTWATAVRTGTISAYKAFVVTFVNTTSGAVNTSEIGVSTAGAISSGDV